MPFSVCVKRDSCQDRKWPIQKVLHPWVGACLYAGRGISLTFRYAAATFRREPPGMACLRSTPVLPGIMLILLTGAWLLLTSARADAQSRSYLSHPSGPYMAGRAFTPGVPTTRRRPPLPGGPLRYRGLRLPDPPAHNPSAGNFGFRVYRDAGRDTIPNSGRPRSWTAQEPPWDRSLVERGREIYRRDLQSLRSRRR